MPKFTILIYETEADWAAADKQTFDRIVAAHTAFGVKFEAQLRGGGALQPGATARTVRGATVTDGPFLETKEALGGFYVIEADDIDAAVEIAKHVPAEFGCVEVRPEMVFGP